MMMLLLLILASAQQALRCRQRWLCRVGTHVR
jgi:hypothetical protein